jgi:uncharacterized OsmC-like protein
MRGGKMSEDGTPDGTIRVSYRREGDDIHCLTLGSTALPDFKIDYSGIAKSERAGTATKLLCSAILYCFASTLASALISRGASVKSLAGSATATKARDSYHRTKIGDIRLEIEVDIDDADLPILDRCRDLMEQGCLVSYSVNQGIEIDHVIRRAGTARGDEAVSATLDRG